MNIDQNIFRMPIYPMLNHMNIDKLNISSTSSHALCVLGQATPSDLNVVNPSALCHIDHLRVTTYPLTQSIDGAWCFDRPSQGGAWYTCPVFIVRNSLDVYKPWWDRAGEIVV